MNLSRHLFIESVRLGGLRCISHHRHFRTVIGQHMSNKIPLMDNTIHCIKPQRFIISRQTCYAASQSEILKCESSKELLSIASRKTLDWNFDPLDLVCIFKSLVHVVYNEISNTSHIHGVNTVFVNLIKNDIIESVLWCRIDGLEIEQLLGSVQSYVDVLDSEGLSSIFKSSVLLGISLENPVMTTLFVRLFDKNVSFTWTHIKRLLIICNLFPHQNVFKAQYLMPKFLRLINSGGLDGSSRPMILTLTQFIFMTKDIIKPEVFSKCIKKTSSCILEDEIFQDWDVITSVLRCIVAVCTSKRKHELITDDLLGTLRVISRKAIESVDRHVDSIPISKYTDIVFDCVTLTYNILTDQVHQLQTFPFFDNMVENCLKQLEKDDISIFDLSCIALPVFVMQKNYEAKSKCWKMIINNLKHADIWMAFKVISAYSHYDMFSDHKMAKIDEQEMTKELVLLLIRNIDYIFRELSADGGFFFSRFISKNVHVIDSELKSYIFTKAIAAFQRQSYTTRSTFILGSIIINFSDVRNIPDTVVNKILAVIPHAEPPIFVNLILAFERVYKGLYMHNKHRFFQIYEICHHKMVIAYKAWLEKNPSLSNAVLVINELYFKRAKKMRSDEENIIYFQNLLPALASNLTVNDFSLSLKKMNYSFFHIYSEQFLDIITDFCVRKSTDLSLTSFSSVLNYMDRVGYQLKNEDFECLHMDLLDRRFDDMTITEQIKHVLQLCKMQIYPEKQIMEIFSLKYLQGVDRFLQEQLNEKKKRKVERMLSSLNTILMIDCPHLNTPWIMQSVPLELEYSRVWLRYSYKMLLAEVEEVLFHVVRGENFYQKEVNLLYGYKGAFVVYLDKTGNLLMHDVGKKTEDQSIQRVVFLVYHPDVYCFGSRKLLGQHERKVRHLQMLGYKVVEVPYYEWNSMYLTTPESKQRYISDKLFL